MPLQHKFLADLVSAFAGLKGLAPSKYPRTCPNEEWSEPEYVMDPDEGDCYDVIWQESLSSPKGIPPFLSGATHNLRGRQLIPQGSTSFCERRPLAAPRCLLIWRSRGPVLSLAESSLLLHARHSPLRASRRSLIRRRKALLQLFLTPYQRAP